MKNITLALVIALGFCAGEAMAQARDLGSPRERQALREQQRAAETPEEKTQREKKEAEGKAEREFWSTRPKEVWWWIQILLRNVRLYFVGETMEDGSEGVENA